MDKDIKDNDINILRLKIDAHVVKQLGEELIADPEQAILELVKNSYDADSPWCSIEIDTQYAISSKDLFKNLKRIPKIDSIDIPLKENSEVSDEDTEILEETFLGRIIIRDKGRGMTVEQVDNGWLTISHSEKRALKSEQKITTEFNRAYQGDKGLGRLSSMKLGRILRITTSTDGIKGICITLDWEMFVSGYTLEQVPLDVELVVDNVTKGTTIEVIALNSLSHWKGEESGGRIQSKLSSLLDPFEMDSNFKVTLTIDQNPFPLNEFRKHLSLPTVAQFDYTYDGVNLLCTGKVRLPFYMPSESLQYDVTAETWYNRYFKIDNGLLFYKRLIEKTGKLKSYNIEMSEEEDWFLNFSQEISWESMDKGKSQSFKNVSKFKSQWNYFFKKGAVFNILTKGQLNADDQKTLDNLAGVGVYKNNFRVGTNRNDWLRFSSDKTSGSGFYSLRPDNVIGYIKFEGYAGEALQEKSDRQGFVENDEYNGFWIVTRAMLKFANEFINTTRRETNLFVKDMVANEAGRPKNYTVQAAATDLDALVEKTEKLSKQNKSSEFETKAALLDATKSIDIALDDLFLDDKSRSEILKLKEKVQLVSSKFDEYRENYDFLEKSVLSHKYTAEKIIDELNGSKSKMEEFYHSAAIGLAAENLVHDINPLLDEISLNSNGIKSKLSELQFKDKSIFIKLNQINSTSRVISKDISLINPMLRSRRNILSKFSVLDAIKEYIEIRQEKIQQKSITVLISNERDIYINFVRGRFTQIIDNLFRNSEYWLEHLGRHSSFSKSIMIEVNSTGVLFWDNGPGIYENMEDVLFEMFETGKSDGQGLGLFIVSTILAQTNCSITLLDERNDYNRKFKFYIDLVGAMFEK